MLLLRIRGERLAFLHENLATGHLNSFHWKEGNRIIRCSNSITIQKPASFKMLLFNLADTENNLEILFSYL